MFSLLFHKKVEDKQEVENKLSWKRKKVWRWKGLTRHGGLTGKLTKCVQYGIKDLYLYRPGFYVTDISGSSRTVHKFVQVVAYRTLAK